MCSSKWKEKYLKRFSNHQATLHFKITEIVHVRSAFKSITEKRRLENFCLTHYRKISLN